MIASDVTFDSMMRFAAGNFTLAEATSFIQVEYGKSDLVACWDGFVDTSNNAGLTFKDRKSICNEFTAALSDYILYLDESAPLSLGQ
jgi:hypothetical protein